MTAKYKQIGNAVPVNLSYAIGRSLVRALNSLEQKELIDLHDQALLSA